MCGCLFQEVDGKHVQIQLTGFMEKNTGRFMKELWILLTSAQKNLSGIPQEFLDVKAEEQRLKKVAVFVWISHFFIFSVFLSLLAKFCSCKFWISWCSSVLITIFGLLLLQQPLQAENDRIVFELQRKREQEKEAEQERLRELASSNSASEIIQ